MTHQSSGTDIIRDALETDVYNCSMINAALQLYPEAWAWMVIVDRDHAIYPKGFAGLLTEKFQDLRSLASNPVLRQFLKDKWGFLSEEFFEWLGKYRFIPEYIEIWQDEEGHLFGKIIGPWSDIMFDEQIFMAVVSQTRNEEMGFFPDDNWVDELLKNIWEMRAAGLKVSEFGLRRRAFNWMHDIITDYLIKYAGDSYVGSSSPYHSQLSDKSPKGTVGHLWYLFHSALYDVENANMAASVAWRAIYGDNLGTALPDTWGRKFYLATLTPGMARLIKSWRWDSGDPFEFTEDFRRFFTHPRNNIDPATNTMIYTDSLSIARAKEIDKVATRWFQTAYGIGGFFTNNRAYFTKTPSYRPLNMVVKPWAFDPYRHGELWTKVAKVPDSSGKNVGDPEVIARIMEAKRRHPFEYYF